MSEPVARLERILMSQVRNVIQFICCSRRANTIW